MTRGKTNIGVIATGQKDGAQKTVYVYNVCDHAACYKELESQAISYTAGVPPAAAAILIARGTWDAKTMVNIEQLDPEPFLDLLGKMGLTTQIEDRTPRPQPIG